MLGHHAVSEAPISALAQSIIIVQIGLATETDTALGFTAVLVPPELHGTAYLKAGASLIAALLAGYSVVVMLRAGYHDETVTQLEASWSTFAALRGSIH